MRNEAYLAVRRSDEECSATQHMDFLRDGSKIAAIAYIGLSGILLLYVDADIKGVP